MEWHTEKRKIKDLIPYEHNPRQMTEKQDKDLERSLDTFDLVEIPAINTDNTILAGHQRCRKLLEKGRGEEKIDVRVPNKKLTEKQVKEYNIRSNRNLGGWDFDKLANNFDMPDLVDWGFEEWEFGVDSEVAAKEDDYEIPEEIKTDIVIGDLFEIGNHRLLCGDSANKEHVNFLMNKKKASCVFTDPPYGVSIGKKNVMLNSFQPSGRNLTDIQSDDLKPEDLKKMLLPAFCNIRTEVMDDDCTVFVTAPQNGELGMMMMMMMTEANLRPRHVLIWMKNSPTFSMGRLDYDYQHEPILLTWGKKHKRPMLGQHKTSIWQIDKPRANKEHPTMKPVELYTNAYLNNSDKNDIVYDAYSGSGTAFVAAHQSQRICTGLEISPHYCQVIIDRMKKLDPDIIIKKNGHL